MTSHGSTPHRFRALRFVVVCGLATVLIAAATTGSARAMPSHDARGATDASSFAVASAPTAGEVAARAQERLYMSMDATTIPSAPRPPERSDDTPWLLIALPTAILLVAIGATSARVRRRQSAQVPV